MKRVMRRLLLPALVGATLLAACGDGDSADRAATTAITISDFRYAPAAATVQAGRKISVRNRDDAPHTLTDRAAGGAFDSGTIKGGQTATVTFQRPGTYAYVCEFHPFMRGTVTVTR
jgi:plastocyanin